MKTFRKPLTKPEEEECLRRWKQGDREAWETLIERNMRLVAHVAKKYSDGEQDMEDLISIGTIGLIKAVNTFHSGRGSRLGTYAAKCIDNEILMMLRTQKKYSRDVSMFEPIGTDKEGNIVSLVDVIEAEDAEVGEKLLQGEDIRQVREFFHSVLNKKDQYVIAMRYGLADGQEHTQREIAEQLGISRSYVSRLEKAALGKLRQAFEGQKKE